jgi:hypothetical protein
MTTVTLDELRQLYDFDAQEHLVRDAVQTALREVQSRLRFFGHYTSWNGFFGSGVAALAGKIGRCRGLFLDPDEPIRAVADRSVYVASFFFDAARDEFDDRDTVHRDTHRCLAQATVKGLLDYERERSNFSSSLDELLREPAWLKNLNRRVATGYGAHSEDDLPALYTSIGYHLGSEVLADKEFSIIDSTLRETAPQIVEYLRNARVHIAGQNHVAYQWIAIHSGHGGGVEADHFAWATKGARLAFRFVPPEQHEALRRHMHTGFLNFASDHKTFFENVNNERAA